MCCALLGRTSVDICMEHHHEGGVNTKPHPNGVRTWVGDNRNAHTMVFSTQAIQLNSQADLTVLPRKGSSPERAIGVGESKMLHRRLPLLALSFTLRAAALFGQNLQTVSPDTAILTIPLSP